jgi:hypothetical protein
MRSSKPQAVVAAAVVVVVGVAAVVTPSSSSSSASSPSSSSSSSRLTKSRASGLRGGLGPGLGLGPLRGGLGSVFRSQTDILTAISMTNTAFFMDPQLPRPTTAALNPFAFATFFGGAWWWHRGGRACVGV